MKVTDLPKISSIKGDEVRISETDETGKWGRLADGRGWISLGEKYIRRV